MAQYKIAKGIKHIRMNIPINTLKLKNNPSLTKMFKMANKVMTRMERYMDCHMSRSPNVSFLLVRHVAIPAIRCVVIVGTMYMSIL